MFFGEVIYYVFVHELGYFGAYLYLLIFALGLFTLSRLVYKFLLFLARAWPGYNPPVDPKNSP